MDFASCSELCEYLASEGVWDEIRNAVESELYWDSGWTRHLWW